MSMINYASREINCKIVYYGPGLGGKTTNLEYVYEKVAPSTSCPLRSTRRALRAPEPPRKDSSTSRILRASSSWKDQLADRWLIQRSPTRRLGRRALPPSWRGWRWRACG